MVSAQELSVTNVKQKINALEVEVTLHNQSSQDVLVVSPASDDRTVTTYFLIPESKTKILQIRRYFYSYPANVLDAPEPCFGLVRVKAGEKYKESFSLEYPVAQSHFFTNPKIDLRTFDSIGFQIGVLPYDDFINKIPDSRPFGHCADGQDKISEGIYKDKTLLEVQNILKTNAVKIFE